MKGKVLYFISLIVIALPWLFLLEIMPIPYSQISTLVEVIIEGTMFIALLIIVALLRKELKRQKASGADKSGSDMDKADKKKDRRSGRVVGSILFVLASTTQFLVGLVLLLIGISYTL
ncbi:MAG TPA: hypothetical protein VM577_12985 [Anaerovoracaceae bacterium]|nr:hypothetical protein [Anaerovoracaceae bacterium]